MDVDDGPARVGGKRHISTGASFRSSQVCKFWQEGRCYRGDSCHFQHTTSLPGTSGRLDGRLEGRLESRLEGRLDKIPADDRNRRWGGRPRRKGPPRPRRACTFWLKGDCNRGSQCHFLHSYSSTKEMEMMTQLKGHTKVVKGIALPAGSSLLYTGSQDKTVKVWNCETGQLDNSFPMTDEVGSLLSESGWLFVGLPNEVKAWNMQTNVQQSLQGPKGQVYALAAHDGTLFAGSQDGSILAWKFDVATSAFIPAFALAGHTNSVVTLQAASGRLYSGSMDKSIRVWDLTTAQCLHILQGHKNVVMGVLCWEQYLLSCSLDGYIKVWAATPAGGLEVTYSYPEEAEDESTLEGALALCGTLDAQGKPVLLCAYNDNTVHLYDLPSFQERGVLYSREEIRVLQVGPPGLFFSGESSGEVKVWCWMNQTAP